MGLRLCSVCYPCGADVDVGGLTREAVEQGWVRACLAELPAVITAAPTLDAARELLADALREYLLSLAESSSTAAGQNGAGHSELLEIVIRDGAAV